MMALLIFKLLVLSMLSIHTVLAQGHEGIVKEVKSLLDNYEVLVDDNNNCFKVCDATDKRIDSLEAYLEAIVNTTDDTMLCNASERLIALESQLNTKLESVATAEQQVTLQTHLNSVATTEQLGTLESQSWITLQQLRYWSHSLMLSWSRLQQPSNWRY